MSHPFEEFRESRRKGNAKALETNNLLTKRFFSLDKQAFGDGALDSKSKELIGLTVSLALRCNECIDYHLEGCVKAGYNKTQIDEAMGIAMLIGGSIMIPHLRHAAESLEFLLQEQAQIGE